MVGWIKNIWKKIWMVGWIKNEKNIDGWWMDRKKMDGQKDRKMKNRWLDG